jgi:phosphopantetheinyl transferase
MGYPIKSNRFEACFWLGPCLKCRNILIKKIARRMSLTLPAIIRIPLFERYRCDQNERCAPVVAAMHIPLHESLDAFSDGLTATELSRGKSIQNPLRRSQYFAGRRLLRRMLEERFGKAATDWQISVEGNHPPRVISGAGAEPPLLSMSHSGHKVICGYIYGGALGVDVQQHKQLRCSWDDITQKVLHPQERLRLERGPEEGRWPGFFRAWALKEATGKALGVGLALPFNKISFTEHAVMETAPDGWGLNGEDWRFASLDIFPGTASAVAWRKT